MTVTDIPAAPVAHDLIHLAVTDKRAHSGHQAVDVITLHFTVVDNTDKAAFFFHCGDDFTHPDRAVPVLLQHAQHAENHVAFRRLQSLHVHVNIQPALTDLTQDPDESGHILRRHIVVFPGIAHRHKADRKIFIVLPRHQLQLIGQLGIEPALDPVEIMFTEISERLLQKLCMVFRMRKHMKYPVRTQLRIPLIKQGKQFLTAFQQFMHALF